MNIIIFCSNFYDLIKSIIKGFSFSLRDLSWSVGRVNRNETQPIISLSLSQKDAVFFVRWRSLPSNLIKRLPSSLLSDSPYNCMAWTGNSYNLVRGRFEST